MATGAMIAAAAVGAAATAYSAHKQAKAARKAAKEQEKAAKRSSNVEREMYYQTRADLRPWRETGQNALAQLWKRVQVGPGEFRQSPGYQFRLQQGEQAIQRSAAARGGLLSGATEKALIRYNQNYATADYDNFLRRYYQSLTPFQSLAGVGQTTGAQLGQLGMNYARGAGNSLMFGANARASGYNALANIRGQEANSYSRLAGEAISLYGAHKGWW